MSIQRAHHRRRRTMKSKIITVVLTAIAMLIAGGIAFITTEPAKALETHSSCMPVHACGPDYVSTPSYVPSPTTVTTAPPKAELATAVRPSSRHTTTSEVPPRLTPEQEAMISPAEMTEAEIAFCDATHQPYGTCKLPESEGMSESPESATDYGLPNS